LWQACSRIQESRPHPVLHCVLPALNASSLNGNIIYANFFA
jgi:hypothetical protein